MHSQRPSAGDREFNFWGASKSIHVENFSDHISGGDIEFGAQAHLDQDGFQVYSSPLLEANAVENINYESFPLLPQNYDSVTQAISDKRRELMEMIRNMPESCYELSLKDIVVEQHGLQEEVAQEIVNQDRSFHSDTEAQTRKHKKKKNNLKIGQLSRIGSMENETFLIKMFFSTSLGSNKKAKAANHSKVSTSSKQSENHKKIDGITRFVISGLNKSIFRKSIGRSTSPSNSSTNRCTDTDFIPGCCSFLPGNKRSNIKGQRGCIF